MSEAFGISKEQIELCARAKGGKKTQALLAALSKTSGFAKAFSDPIGQEVMLDAIELSSELLEKIVNVEATEAEIAEYRALRKITERWQQIWAKHKNAMEELQKQ